MNHPTGDELLLLAYGELPAAHVARVEAHLGECAACRAQFTRLDASHVALDTVFLTSSGPRRRVHPEWRPTSTWSATAGYVTGGRAMVEIDAQLTRLEQERYHGLSN